MKNYRNSDYAANKNARGIVYRFADGVVEVTLEDYLRENPNKTAANFAELKVLSDSMYLLGDRAEYRQTWKNIPAKGFEEVDEFCVPSAESAVIDIPQHEADEEHKRSLMKSVLAKLTETQQRRYIQSYARGKTVREIAAAEGVSFQVVDKSILSAKKKIIKNLKKL